MMQRNGDARATVLACVAGAIPAAERQAHFALIRHLFGTAVQERRALADGLACRFPVAALEEVARFVANERRCCPFLRFTLELAPGADSLWLRLTGPRGTAEFLAAELPG